MFYPYETFKYLMDVGLDIDMNAVQTYWNHLISLENPCKKCERQIRHSNPIACSWVWAIWAQSAGTGLGMAYNLKFNSWSHDFVFIYFALIGTA